MNSLFIYIKDRKRSLWRILGLFFIYGFLKSIVYFAPLLLNNVLDDVVLFGRFEYALNIGQTCASFLALGLPSAYTYYVYKSREDHLTPIFHNIFVGLSVTLLLLALIPGFIDNIYYNSFAIGLVIANQLFITTKYKIQGKNVLSVVVDCGLYILLFGLTILFYLRLATFSFGYWSCLLLLYATFLNLKYHKDGVGNFRFVSMKDWKKVVSYGALIVVTQFLTSLLNTSTRIYIEHFNNFLDVGIYSLYIRVASAIIIFHRVIVILLFRRIYIESHRKLDRYFARILIVALCVCLLMFLAVPHFFPDIMDNSYVHHSEIFLFSLFQAVSWTTISLLELIIYRENLLKTYVFVLSACLFGMFICMLFCEHYLKFGVAFLVWVNVLFILLAAFCQLYILNQIGLRYFRTFIMQFIIFCVFVASGAIMLVRTL